MISVIIHLSPTKEKSMIQYLLGALCATAVMLFIWYVTVLIQRMSLAGALKESLDKLKEDAQSISREKMEMMQSLLWYAFRRLTGEIPTLETFIAQGLHEQGRQAIIEELKAFIQRLRKGIENAGSATKFFQKITGYVGAGTIRWKEIETDRKELDALVQTVIEGEREYLLQGLTECPLGQVPTIYDKLVMYLMEHNLPPISSTELERVKVSLVSRITPELEGMFRLIRPVVGNTEAITIVATSASQADEAARIWEILAK